jgi:sarcosine oxidase subunit gamma
LTPLGAANARIDQIGTITLREVTDRALASLTCRNNATPAFNAAAAGFGLTLPKAGYWTDGQFGAIWTGVDQWVIDAPYGPDLALELKSVFGESASVTEQTDAWARFDILGAARVDLLERLCPAPSRRMGVGMATRSTVEHIGCLLICDADRFRLMCARSYAGSLHHALTMVAQGLR